MRMERILVVLLSALSISLFFVQRGIAVFGMLSIGALLVWRFYVKHEVRRTVPPSLVILSVLFICSFAASALVSDNFFHAVTKMTKYRYLFFAGLLFTAPLSHESRRKIAFVFFIAAALAGLFGFLQAVDLAPRGYDRAHGYSSHPILYAGLLAFVCGSTVLMVFMRSDSMQLSRQERYALYVILFFTFTGVLLSESRGVWVALIAACGMTLAVYDPKKTLVFMVSITGLLLLVFSFSPGLKSRASSIITSLYTEDEKGSMGGRIELWKASWLMFKRSPLLGAGVGEFQDALADLVREKKVNKPLAVGHAHNIFMHALATRGIIGFIILIAILLALIRWGFQEIDAYGGIGGYVILLSTLLTVIGGLTELNIEISKYLAGLSLTIGLLGAYDAQHQNDLSVTHNEMGLT